VQDWLVSHPQERVTLDRLARLAAMSPRSLTRAFRRATGITVKSFTQKVKLAVIEAEWETQKAPASFTAFGFPNDAEGRTDHAIRIPWLLGLIATRSVTG